MENKDKMKCRESLPAVVSTLVIASTSLLSTVCSRLVEKLKTDQDKDKNMDLTFHCSSNGNFEPLQCNRGMCYCADEYTGQPRSFFVPEKLWRVLPCCKCGISFVEQCEKRAIHVIM